MLTTSGNLHLEIQTSRKNPVGILRTSFRDSSHARCKPAPTPAPTAQKEYR